MEKLKGELSDIELERQARLEALSTNKAALRSQISRIRETIRRLLHADKTLAERIRTLPRTGDNDREHPYSNRHGDKHSRPCCHRWLVRQCRRRLQCHPTRAGSRSGLKSTYRPLGVPWPISPARPLRPCPESKAQSSLGS